MSTQNNPTAEAEGSLFDDLVSFEMGLPMQEDHENDAAGSELDPKEDPIEENNNDASEEQPAVEQTEDVDPEGDDSPALADGVDPRINALFGILQTENMLSEDHGLEAKIESLPQLAETVGGTLFKEYLGSLPPSARDLIDIAAANPSLGVAELRQFFDQHVDHQVEVPQDDEQAATYMRNFLAKQGVFTDTEDIEASVERLLTKGTLLSTAKQKAEAEIAQLDKQREATITQAKESQEARLEQQRAFYNSVFSSIEETPWSKERQTKVRQAVDPKNVQRINDQVRQSPQAVAQLGLLYSFYDPKTKQFDLSAFQEASAGKQGAETKRDLKSKAHEAALASIGTRQAKKQDKDTGFWENLVPAN